MADNKVNAREELIRKQIVEKGLKGKLSPAMVIRIPKQVLEPMVMDGIKDQEICKKFSCSPTPISYLRAFYGLPTYAEVREMLACVTEDDDGDDGRVAAKQDTKKSFDEAMDAIKSVVPVPEQETVKKHDGDAVDALRYALTDAGGPFMGKMMDDLRNAHKVQGNDGNWNSNDYMLGYYNGLELALAIFEDREPEFRTMEPVIPEPIEAETPLLSRKDQAQLIAPLLAGVAKMLDRKGKDQVEVIVTVSSA